MQGRKPGSGFLTGGKSALAQHVLLHDRDPIGLGWGIRRYRHYQVLQLMEHQGLAGVRAAVGHPEAQCRQIAHGVCGLPGFGAGASDGHAGVGTGCPGRAQVEAALRLSAHAARLRSCGSLALGIPRCHLTIGQTLRSQASLVMANTNHCWIASPIQRARDGARLRNGSRRLTYPKRQQPWPSTPPLAASPCAHSFRSSCDARTLGNGACSGTVTCARTHSPNARSKR